MCDDQCSSTLHGNQLSSTLHGNQLSSTLHGDQHLSTLHGDQHLSTLHGDQRSSVVHDNQNWSMLGGFQPSILHGLQQPLSAMHDSQQLALGAQSTTLDVPTSLLSISASDIAAFDESFKNSAFWDDLDRFIVSDLNGRQTASTLSSNFTDMLSSVPFLFNSFSSPPRPAGQLEFLSPLHLPAPAFSLPPHLPAPSFSSSPCLPAPSFSSSPRLPAPSFSPPTKEVVQLGDPEGM